MDPGGSDGSGRLTRRQALAGVGAGLGLGLAGCTGVGGTADRADGLSVFHAGSLSPPFARLESTFEAERDVAVSREARGSVRSTQKVTAEGRRADVLGVADYRLLRDRLLPEFGSWYAVVASNAMTIHYTPDSTGADDLARDAWWEVLSRQGVRIGHSDPAADPSGYRAVMCQQLGAVPFEGEALYGEETYRALRANSRVTTDTETNLVGQLRSGKLDYAFSYRSMGETADVEVLDLQPAVDLSRTTPAYAAHYAKASVETASGTFTGAPVAYGVTVPDVARSPALGTEWVAHVCGERGRETLRATGFEPIRPAVVPRRLAGAVPDRLEDRVRTTPSLGPLEL